METNSAKPVIYALTDGRAGNVAMATGLAQRVARLTGGAVETYEAAVSGALASLPPWLQCRFPSLSRAMIREMHLESETLPDMVIGAGRRVAPLVAALRRPGTKVVQVLDPKMPLRRFDRVVIPQHDRVSGGNVIETLGSVGGVTRWGLDAARREWAAVFAPLRRPLLAVLIGGNTKRRTVKSGGWQTLAADLAALVPEAGMAITLSRRTGPGAEALLRDTLPEVWIWDGKGRNPYFGMLAHADAVLVTDDSINMASEAAATGAPLAIWPLLEEGGKTARFHEALYAAGHAEPFSGAMPTACNGALDETGRVAGQLMDLL